jgi:hypothetical protein
MQVTAANFGPTGGSHWNARPNTIYAIMSSCLMPATLDFRVGSKVITCPPFCPTTVWHVLVNLPYEKQSTTILMSRYSFATYAPTSVSR